MKAYITGDPNYVIKVTGAENYKSIPTPSVVSFWSKDENNNIFYEYGNVGIGTTNPTSLLELYTSDGNIKLGDITAQSTTDVGISFSGLGTYTSSIFTEVNGEILSYGINTPQIQNPRNTGRVGGIFRLDTRPSGVLGDSSCFVVKYAPVGVATATGGFQAGIKNGIIISLQNGQTYLVPDEGNVLVGLKTDTGTANQILQVDGGAYINDSVGIGTTNPTSKLQVQGDVLVSGVITSTDYNSASDINLKENIQLISNPIDKVLQLNGVTFDWKKDGRSSMGVIAQEVEEIFPELVNTAEYKSVNYNGLIGVLIEAVKELKQEVNELRGQINSTRNESP